ncbi:MAG: hypothetical protein A3C70_02965 [Candidatus Zambryskibacteria bacterium RIFCSPHIGHO2_02_FULL_43_14]|uniref:Uncharacterized protein n=1 Tax=Candidatus Zambryskibacteria bacterium RIFCSPHIGHO2_02_FULL_43_14 TaxID=1802748 RepID=A0A1G2TFI3_9BACT|nr:MAG: hypothetical protein A2829_00480 [Candidatus Zambryskibacteria bacterium RIFCSPHIGHO2_01_FULL_43_60]OHA95942.1 MAG: hypothetical protein A3C70_02965 [Candidatus Zambryskibacteria bacterium RIFCSPHIGHO2_02_FULL_43_14]OHB03636.1 MAG: hypothetical protein A3B03_02870 [Candidatus Zambryskibacteria bacterium RIFCSPLOWO2_01_FULL_42_41]
MKKLSVVLLSLSIFFVMGAFLVSAQGGVTGGPGGNPGVSASLPNPFSGGSSLFALMKTIVDKIILPIGGVLAVLAFVYSGFLYVMAQGNESKIKEAHKALLYTSVGTAVLLGSWVLANVICNTIAQLGGPACPA